MVKWYEVAPRIMDRTNHIPVIFCSDFSGQRKQNRYLWHGFPPNFIGRIRQISLIIWIVQTIIRIVQTVSDPQLSDRNTFWPDILTFSDLLVCIQTIYMDRTNHIAVIFGTTFSGHRYNFANFTIYMLCTNHIYGSYTNQNISL